MTSSLTKILQIINLVMSYLHIKFWHYSALTLASLYQKLFEDGLHPRTPTSSPFGLFEVKKSLVPVGLILTYCIQ